MFFVMFYLNFFDDLIFDLGNKNMNSLRSWSGFNKYFQDAFSALPFFAHF